MIRQHTHHVDLAIVILLEAAFTATFLLRGFTLWLPMLPGLWVAWRELR